MMTKMREMSFIFLWILVFAFLGLMVLEWGADITGRTRQENIVGKVDGRKITIEEFNQVLQNAYENERQRLGKELEDADYKRIQDEVWENFVQQILMDKEIERLGIQITRREVAYHSVHNPPQIFQQIPQLQTDGKFDIQKYRQALRDPQFEANVVTFVAQNLPYQKLIDRITVSVMVTEQEVKDEFMRENMRARIEYLGVPISRIDFKSIQVSEEESRRYYEDHKEDFKVEEKRVLRYVLFPTLPSKQDTVNVYRLAQELIEEARAGADFSKLADTYSEDPSVRNNHGDLGYFKKSDMVPEFAEAAFSAKPGEIVGPVKTQFGLHIIKVVDKKREEGIDKVRAFHILLKFTPSALTIDDARDEANLFAEIASEDGFEQAAEELKREIKTTPPFVKRNFIPGLGQLEGAVTWAFRANVGDVSEVYRTTNGYVVFELTEIQAEGYRPFEEVKNICKNRVISEKRKALAREYAEKIGNSIAAGKSFAAIVEADTSGKVVHDSTGFFKYGAPIPKLGLSVDINAAAFALPMGKASNLLESPQGYYYIRVLERTDFDEKQYAQQREFIKQRLMQQKQFQVFQSWYEQLKAKAEIEDYRYRFFRG